MKDETFEDWKILGYRVKRGEKATGRNKAGVATFKREQVEEDENFDRRNNLHFERDDR